MPESDEVQKDLRCLSGDMEVAENVRMWKRYVGEVKNLLDFGRRSKWVRKYYCAILYTFYTNFTGKNIYLLTGRSENRTKLIYIADEYATDFSFKNMRNKLIFSYVG